jgi:hypothetical protein
MRFLQLLALVALLAAPTALSGQDPDRDQDSGPELVGDELLPRHMSPRIVKSIQRGLAYLASVQSSDGSWTSTPDGAAYPVAMTGLGGMALLASGSTSSRGPYADEISKAMRYLMRCSTKNGLITSPGEDNGVPMFGHGFSLLFLATLYGMENDPDVRREMVPIIQNAITLTAKGQSKGGGWLYYPGGGDEGSVTITQLQALRACHNAGFLVPIETVDKAVEYLEKCKTSEGGICYSLSSRGSGTRLPITAAAVACLYNAGEYDSELADTCLEYIRKHIGEPDDLNAGGAGGHAYYTHLYAAQAFYTAGEEFWGTYFPAVSKLLLTAQNGDGSWDGDSVGPVYGSSIALVVLQLPYKLLPIYQR